MATTASGALNDPSLAPLIHWAPVLCWTIAGVVLLALSMAQMRQKASAGTGWARKIDD
jgi:hypothetical protein